ncbi:MAG: glycoside hydrolase family 3 C-terminal domain-containing protein [Anaerolineales bacterium]
MIEITKSVPATCFPTASALAATWDRALVQQVGQALGEECRQEKVGVILGPGANIKRSPLCGRNFEYFSEDPFLAGEMAASHIRGVQSQGIGASLKHYAVNNQETRRMSIDAVVDERALREIYLAGFERAVKSAQPWTVMCAYNRVNGIFCSENEHLIAEILKGEWTHAGLVVTDWGAMDERVPALKAGVELEMPGMPNGDDEMIVAAVRAGELEEAVLDRAAEHILTLIFKAQETLARDFTYDSQAHHALARRVAGAGAVLLKNEAGLLPLQPTARVALIGRFAKTPRYQGGGSSLINPTRLDCLYDEMVSLAGAEQISYAPGYTESGDQADETLIQEALAAASAAEVVVVSAGLTDRYETEGLDRKHMRMPPGHDALIQRLAAAHARVVVVLSNGSPVEMPWAQAVLAILEGYLGGQAGAGAIADILYGKVNPSGKLAETFPLRLEDNPSYAYFPGGPVTVEYRESLFVGYRYYDTVGQAVLFPFGHGLSYTRFEYSDLEVKQPGAEEQNVTVTCKVKNVGGTAGQEIVQVYVHDVQATPFRPEKELKGFAKVELGPGEEQAVSIELDRRAFAYYDTQCKEWVVEAGDFEILAGASSQDIRLRVTIQIASSQAVPPVANREALAAYYAFPKGQPVGQPAFAALLGRPVPPSQGPHMGGYTFNTPVGDMHDSLIGRQFYAMMSKQMHKMILGSEDTPTGRMVTAMVKEMPLRGMLMLGGAGMSRAMLEALLMLMNGHLLKGLVALIKANAAKKK